MLFALVILGIYMGWVEAVYGKRPEPRGRGLSDGAEDDGGSRIGERPPLPEARIGHDSSASSLSSLPPIPEFYLRPELIPVKGDGLPAVAEAERVVRSRR
jgi:hypothetical protein